MILYQMAHGHQEQQKYIIWSLLVVVEVVVIAHEPLVVEVVELEVIELLVMDQVHYKDQHKN
jgi:hypothetical protein